MIVGLVPIKKIENCYSWILILFTHLLEISLKYIHGLIESHCRNH
jgi:hypothetical protein